MIGWLKRRVKFEGGVLSGSHHGPNEATLRRTARLYRMGSYAKSWTLYVYRGDGRAHRFMVMFPLWRGEWPSHLNEPMR